MKSISIIEMGTDSNEHITPVAIKEIMESDIIIRKSEQLEGVELGSKEIIDIAEGVDKISGYIKSLDGEKKLVLLLTDDPDCDKLRKLVKKELSSEAIKIVPGRNALRYLAGKFNLQWESIFYCNFFYSERELLQRVRAKEKVYTFTDRVWTPQAIARYLLIYDLGQVEMFVGCNLSYDDEIIFREQASVLAHDEREVGMAIVVIINDPALNT